MKNRILKVTATLLCVMTMAISLGSCGLFDEFIDLIDDIDSSSKRPAQSSSVDIVTSDESFEEMVSSLPENSYDEDGTYLQAKTFVKETYELTIYPYKAKIRVGESFDVKVALSTNANPSVSLRPCWMAIDYYTIDGTTVTALEPVEYVGIEVIIEGVPYADLYLISLEIIN